MNNSLRGMVSWCLCCLMAAGVAASAPDARQVMDRFSEVFRTVDGVEVAFTWQMGAEVRPEKGIVCLQGNKFVLDVGDVKTWFDGTTQWSYLPSTQEVNVSLPTAEELRTIHPFAWLSLLRSGYEVRLERESAKAYHLVLSAVEPGQAVQCIWLEIDRQTYYPLSLRIRQGDGLPDGILSVWITGVKMRQAYPDSFFVFDAGQYPDVEVIDLR